MEEGPATSSGTWSCPRSRSGPRRRPRWRGSPARACLEIIRQDYVRAARAKGLAERAVIARHVLKNAFNPILTVVGVQVGYLLGGAILTETVFSWPGLGSMMVRAIQARDYPLVQGGVLLIATTFVLVNLIVDLLYAVFDPRIR